MASQRARASATHRLAPCLTPQGRLVLAPADDGPDLDAAFARRTRQAFARGAGHGLLRLGGVEVGLVMPPVFAYWRDLGSRYITALCTRPDVEDGRAEIPAPPASDLEALASGAPVMRGAEYLTPDVLHALWDEICDALATEIAESGCTVQQFLKKLNPTWNVVGRVHFNLAENRQDEEAPFAFLATYTSRLSAHGKAQHQPLGQALREYAGAANRERLLSLLLPVQRAAARCGWLKDVVRVAVARSCVPAPANQHAPDANAQEAGASAVPGGHRGPHHRADVLGQGLV